MYDEHENPKPLNPNFHGSNHSAHSIYRGKINQTSKQTDRKPTKNSLKECSLFSNVAIRRIETHYCKERPIVMKPKLENNRGNHETRRKSVNIESFPTKKRRKWVNAQINEGKKQITFLEMWRRQKNSSSAVTGALRIEANAGKQNRAGLRRPMDFRICTIGSNLIDPDTDH